MHEHSGGTWLQHFRFVYWFGRHKPRRDLAAWMFFFLIFLLKFDYFVDLHIVKKCGGHDKRLANALRHRWCFSSVVQQRRSFSRKQVECLTHIRRAWRPGKQFAIWLSSGVWVEPSKGKLARIHQSNMVKLHETAQVKQLVWLFGVIKTHRNMTWQKEWAVDGSSIAVVN